MWQGVWFMFGGCCDRNDDYDKDGPLFALDLNTNKWLSNAQILSGGSDVGAESAGGAGAGGDTQPGTTTTTTTSNAKKKKAKAKAQAKKNAKSTSTKSIEPRRRYEHSSCVYDDKWYVFGGQDRSDEAVGCLGDLWKFTFATRVWREL